MSPLRYTCKSTYNLQDELRAKGWDISAETIRLLLPQMGYSLQAPAKTKEGAQHPDRDSQFRYINDTGPPQSCGCRAVTWGVGSGLASWIGGVVAVVA